MLIRCTVYLQHIPFYVSQALLTHTSITCIVSYGGQKLSPIGIISASASTPPPQLLHVSGPAEPRRRESCSIVPNPVVPVTEDTAKKATEAVVKTYRYAAAKKDADWILPASPDYHASSATMAHTRTLSFLKPLLNGPYFDLEAIWEEHCKYEFEERDVEKTMATMVAEPYVNHIPTMTGGIGKKKLTEFYREHFVFSNPDDVSIEVVSRTVGVDRVVDEFVMRFTHSRVVDWV
jgi:carboxymethylenebutenolidase